jgi:hypothetical protein
MSAPKRPFNARRSKTSAGLDKSKGSVFRCPACGSNRVRAIVYGLPSEELMEDASRERVILGGCTIVDGRPMLACLDCERRWS